MNPSSRHNFEALDPLEWLAHMSDHIPDPEQHRTLFHGEYSSRARGAAHSPEVETLFNAELSPRQRCSPSWATLIAKFYQLDLLLGSRCGQHISIVDTDDHRHLRSLLSSTRLPDNNP